MSFLNWTADNSLKSMMGFSVATNSDEVADHPSSLAEECEDDWPQDVQSWIW